MTIPEQNASMIRAASIHTGLSVEQIKAPGRVSAASEARWACYIVMRESGMTFIEIGAVFGRHYSTVIKGLQEAARHHGKRENSFRQLCEAVKNHAGSTQQ